MAPEKYQKGIENIKELTSSTDENPTGFMDIGEGFKDLDHDLSQYVVEFAFGDIYSRQVLVNKLRVLTTITCLVTQVNPQIGMHIKTVLIVGLTPEEIVGCFIHLIPYVGFPSVLNALKVTQEVFNELGVKITPSEG